MAPIHIVGTVNDPAEWRWRQKEYEWRPPQTQEFNLVSGFETLLWEHWVHWMLPRKHQLIRWKYWDYFWLWKFDLSLFKLGALAKECFERRKNNEGMKCKSFEVKVLPCSLAYTKLGCHMSFMQNFFLFKLALWRAPAMKEKEKKKALKCANFCS